MEDVDDIKNRLLYLENLTHSVINIPTRNGKDGDDVYCFKQQLNSYLSCKFKGGLHEQNLSAFKMNGDILKEEILEHKGSFIELSKGKERFKLSEVEVRANDINLDYCFGCQNYFIPCVNLKIRVEYPPKNQKPKTKSGIKGKKTQRCLSYECLICGVRIKIFNVLENKGTKNLVKEAEKVSDFKLNQLPIQPVLNRTSSGRVEKEKSKKSRKKKTSGLGALLAKKKSDSQAADMAADSSASIDLFKMFG